MEDNVKHIGLTDKQRAAAAASAVDPVLLHEAHLLMEREKEVTIRRTLRTHWKGAFFSIGLSLALVMDGFDGGMVFSFFGHPAFKRQFGELQPDGSYLLSADWQSGISNGTTAGNVIGLLITLLCQERFGSKRTYLAGMLMVTAAIFLPVFSKSVEMYLAAAICMAIPWGIFQTLTTAYAAEIAPLKIRGILASCVNMCWGIGLCLAAGVGRASLHIESQWAWRLPLCLQWIWPVPLALICYFAPESPWWLVRKGRIEDAKRALAATAVPGHYTDRELEAYCTLMKHTDNIEKAEAKAGQFWDCFRGSNLRRTEIMFGVWLIQVWSGQGITALTVVFFESAGMAAEMAFSLNIALTSMIIAGTIVAWYLLPRYGRRPLYLFGLAAIAVPLIVIGSLAMIKEQTQTVQYTSAGFMIFISFSYNISIAPLCYTISGELPSARLRSYTIVMGRALYVLCGFITGQLNPRMLSPTAWNWAAKSAWFWLGCNALCTLWTFFRLPETSGFSFAELDILFANKTPTRHFTKVVIHDDAGADSAEVQDEPVYDLKDDTKLEQITHLEHTATVKL